MTTINANLSSLNLYSLNSTMGESTNEDTSTNTGTENTNSDYGDAVEISLSTNAEQSLEQIAEGETITLKAPYKPISVSRTSEGGASSFSGWAETDGGISSGHYAGAPSDPIIDDSYYSKPVNVNINRALTDDEKIALSNFRDANVLIGKAINSMPSNAIIKFTNGGIVTAAEIKSLWENTDFNINEIGTKYRNGASGESAYDYTNNKLHVSINIDLLIKYQNTSIPKEAASTYLILHELGHGTNVGLQSNEINHADGKESDDEHRINEIIANDFAKAMADLFVIPYLINASNGRDSQGINAYSSPVVSVTYTPFPEINLNAGFGFGYGGHGTNVYPDY